MTTTGPSVRTLRIVRGVWIVGFMVGTCTHIADLVVGGTGAYEGFPLGVRLLWTALTVLDPTVVVLLLLRLCAGIVLGVTVILADVAVNWTVFALVGGLSVFGVVAQSLFAIFIVSTMGILWSWFTRSSRP
ncbi:hypothetical protein EV379_2808 [Microterricola gilva]|uniref:DoxX-like protein n=1 Tax=Microterricola gilva TaxID=393267 RepID=A0A4Q8AQF9_9MICO|nr:hypothetical protein [Microterricola gilva]RZU66451.1 hypothetical protein EV379_2808 [Microterricola gilva]